MPTLDSFQTIVAKEVQSAFGYMHRQVWTHPALGTATAVKAAFTLLAGAQPGITAGITQPDFPRILSIKGTKAGATLTGDVVIHGTDIRGNVISDTIALNDNTEVFGVKAFKTVTSIDFPARTTAADTVSIGRGDKLGLDRVYTENGVLHGNVDGVREANAPVIIADADIAKNTVDFDTALANTKVYVLATIATEKTYKRPTTA